MNQPQKTQRVITDRVEFPMTPEEVVLTARKLTKLMSEGAEKKRANELEVESLKTQVKHAKEMNATDEAEHAKMVEDLRRSVETGKEMRPVACYEKFDLKAQTVVRIRSDTQEVVRSRPMDEGEIQLAYQGELFPKPPPDAAAAEKGERDDTAALAGVEAAGRKAPGANDATEAQEAVTPASDEPVTPH